MGEVALLIGRARGGSREAFGRICELLCPEFWPIAHRHLSRGSRGGLMEATARVNESCLKFVQCESLIPSSRSHLLEQSAAVIDLNRSAPRLGRVVEIRCVGGMGDAASAEALTLCKRTVARDRDQARRLLAHAMHG